MASTEPPSSAESNTKRAAEEVSTAENGPVSKKQKRKPANTMMLVSPVPETITLEEVADWTKIAGMLKLDPLTEEPLIKRIDSDPTTVAVSFLYKESLQQAMLLLDDTTLAGTKAHTKVKIDPSPLEHTERTVFGPKVTPGQLSQLSSKSDQKKAKKLMTTEKQRLERGSWGEPEMKRRHVVFENLFQVQSDEVRDPEFFQEIKESLKEVCTEECGQVEHVKIFERHPKGIAAI